MGGASKIIKKVLDHGSKFSIGDRILKVGVHAEKEKSNEAPEVENQAASQLIESPDAEKSKEVEDETSAAIARKRGKSSLKINRTGGNVSGAGTGANV